MGRGRKRRKGRREGDVPPLLSSFWRHCIDVVVVIDVVVIVIVVVEVEKSILLLQALWRRHIQNVSRLDRCTQSASC